MNNWITGYISDHSKNQSRYEIDNYLIQSGYDPQEIEETWQKIKYKPSHPKKPRLLLITDIAFKLIVLLYAVALTFFLIIFPKGEVNFFTILEVLLSVGLLLAAVVLRSTRYAVANWSLVLAYILVVLSNLHNVTLTISSVVIMFVITIINSVRNENQKRH